MSPNHVQEPVQMAPGDIQALTESQTRALLTNPILQRMLMPLEHVHPLETANIHAAVVYLAQTSKRA